jgi:hypothetical protein
MPDQKLPFNLVASILFWFWGICVLIGIFVVLLMRGANVAPWLPLVFIAWGIAFCAAGFAMRRRRWGVRWWGAGLCVISIVWLLVFYTPQILIGIVINLGALGLLLASWREIPRPL